MKYQQVSVDLVNMMMTACSYLALAGAAWVFLRLLQACFWLPRHLRKQNNVQKFLQDKIDSYEKYLADCEAKDNLNGIKENNVEGISENSEKWRKQRESLESLKKELNKVKEGVNISDWDYLLEDNTTQEFAIDSKYIDGTAVTASDDENYSFGKQELHRNNSESLIDKEQTKDHHYKKDDDDNTCEKKDN